MVTGQKTDLWILLFFISYRNFLRIFDKQACLFIHFALVDLLKDSSEITRARNYEINLID